MAEDFSRALIRKLRPKMLRQPAVRLLLAVRESYRAVRGAPGRASRWLTQLALETLPREPAPPLQSFLAGEYNDLLKLQRRQFALEAFDKAWTSACGGKTCTIHDDIVFNAMVDVDSKNVIDLASWAIGTADRGQRNVSDPGLLGYVKQEYLTQLPPKRAWRSRRDESAGLARLTDDGYLAARARLFPKAVGRELKPGDVDRLIETFNKGAKPVVDDRNKNHAHTYENRTHGTAVRVSLPQMRDLHTYTWSILDDLGLMALGSKWAQNDMNSADTESTARELIDMVLLPEWFRDEMRKRGIDRAAYYDALQNDPAPGDFNNQAKLEALADRTDFPPSCGGGAVVRIKRRTLPAD